MKQYIQNIEDITDSVEIMYEKPKRSISLFAYILLFLIIVAIVWACIGKFDYCVKASGLVRPANSVSTIIPSVSGKIETVNIEEGQIVKKGDVLFTINSDLTSQTLKAYEEQQAKVETELSNLNKYLDSLNEEKNFFDVNNLDESDYYYKFKQYQNNVETSLQQYTNTNMDINKVLNDADLSYKNSSDQLEKYKSNLDQIDYLISSIQSKSSHFSSADKTNVYYSMYKDFSIKLESYNLQIEAQEDSLYKTEELYEVGGASKSQVTQIETEIESLNQTKQQLIQSTLTSVKQTKDQTEKNISELELNLKSSQSAKNTYTQKGYSIDLLKEQLRLEAITATTNSITSTQNTLNSVRLDIEKLNDSLNNTKLTAPIDGKINVYKVLTPSDFIQSGTQVCTIVPGDQSQFKVMLYINSNDIAEIEENQKVKVRISALPYQEYGEIYGTLHNISSDSRMDNASGAIYYTAECIIDGNSLKSKDGVIRKITSGMDCQIRVVTKQRRIIRWALEKLNFID